MVIPRRASACAAMNLPFGVFSAASLSKALAPPCCTTCPRRSCCSQMALKTLAIISRLFLLSVVESATNATVTPDSASSLMRFSTCSLASSSCSSGTCCLANLASSLSSGKTSCFS
uniref:Putative secreted protein n=1 Tax=Ixodes ricinus TaxID=34613 RepID=A0A6B0ULH5_IXORI